MKDAYKKRGTSFTIVVKKEILNNLYLYTKVFKVMNMNYDNEKQELHDYHFVQYTFIVDATDQKVTPFD